MSTPDKEQIRHWLQSFPPRLEVEHTDDNMVKGETQTTRQDRIFKSLIYDLSLAIDEFGYEAVYFGVGCEVFPNAVDGWQGNDH
jgi:hypothetical protein